MIRRVRTRLTSKEWLATAASLALLGVLIFSPYIFLFIEAVFDPVNRPWGACDDPPADAVFCMEGFADDGHIRHALLPSDLPNCCISWRRVLDFEANSERVRVCDAQDSSPVRCEAAESLGPGRLVIDGRDLTVDTSWEGHSSPFLYD